MDIRELKKIRKSLDKFVKQFDDCIKTEPSRRHLVTYLNGQLSSLERKSIEPIALDAGVAPRTLQEFLSIHRWDEKSVGERLRELVIRDHSSSNGIGIIDETSFAKKGDKTPGVQRQHCGATGKTDNCVVTVHLGYANEDFHALIDGDLYLPKEEWSQNRERCREAGIPEDVVYRPKWQIALELLERSLREGVPIRWVTADEDYGRASEFRKKVSSFGLNYIVEIPPSITGWIRPPEVEGVGTRVASGRVLTKARVAAGSANARRVSNLWERGGPQWKRYQIKITEKGPIVWEFRKTKFYPNQDGVPGEKETLLVGREVLTGEIKYFLSNAAEEVPISNLLFVAFSRWRIERLIEDGKSEVGFDHFEVRSYHSLMRHMVLTMMSLYFLCDQTKRLREKKSAMDAVAGEMCGGRAIGRSGVVGEAKQSSYESCRHYSVSADEEREGGLLS